MRMSRGRYPFSCATTTRSSGWARAGAAPAADRPPHHCAVSPASVGERDDEGYRRDDELPTFTSEAAP